jgi:hypothetical protein
MSRRPQQAHVPNQDNLPSGAIIYDGAIATGRQQRLQYRTLAGVKRATVDGPEALVWPLYLQAVAELGADARKMQQGLLVLSGS